MEVMAHTADSNGKKRKAKLEKILMTMSSLLEDLFYHYFLKNIQMS